MADARTWLERIRALPLRGRIRVLNVCGGHERSISMAGLRGALPREIELIPGPGCPVCVCPEEDIYAAIQLALRKDVILVAFGDMLRVPANSPKASRARWSRRVRPAAMSALSHRRAKLCGSPRRMPIAKWSSSPPASRRRRRRSQAWWRRVCRRIYPSCCRGGSHGLRSRCSLKAKRPASRRLSHRVMSRRSWDRRNGHFVPDKHGIPSAVAGFESDSLLAALYSVLRQHLEGRAFLDNCYAHVAKPGGNPTARRLLAETMDVADATWRGIGTIPRSGFALKPELEQLDAMRRFQVDPGLARKRMGEMPPGCDCARVVLGKIYPNECALFGRACTPRNPIGPCMVSDEGACRIWWASGIRHAATESATPARY